MNETKPCPFCGGTLAHVEREPPAGAYVLCDTCNAQGPESTDWQIAIQRWNNRHVDAGGGQPGETVRLCEACEQSRHWDCGRQTWCECDCDPELALEQDDRDRCCPHLEEPDCVTCGGEGWVESIAETTGRWGWDDAGPGRCPNCGGSGLLKDCTTF